MVSALITRQQHDGDVDFLAKPVDKGRLIAAVEKAATHHNLTAVNA